MAVCCLAVTACSKDKESEPVKLESLELYPAAMELKMGKQIRPEIRFTPQNYAPQSAPKWSSSDIQIIKVDETGLITALKIGSANVTMQLEGKESTTKVTVLEADPVPPEQNPAPIFKIQPETMMLSTSNIGEQIPLNLVVMPESTDISGVAWESSEPSAVTVDQKGVITILSKGTATITAKVNKSTAQCTIYVTA